MHLRFCDSRRSHVAPRYRKHRQSNARGSSLRPPRGPARATQALDLMLEQAFLVARPVALALVGPLVVQLLALGQAEFELGPAPGPVEIERNEGVALPLGGADQAVEFLAGQQQLAAAGRVRLDVGGSCRQRRDV